MGRSGGTGGRGAALGHGSSGGKREGSGQLLWAGFMAGGVIRRRLDGWAGSMSDENEAEWEGPMLDGDPAEWESPMSDGDVAGSGGPMLDWDAAGSRGNI